MKRRRKKKLWNIWLLFPLYLFVVNLCIIFTRHKIVIKGDRSYVGLLNFDCQRGHQTQMAHRPNRRSLDVKWKVLRCAHALPGINVRAQKWRYTVSRPTPVSDSHRLSIYSTFTPNWSKFGQLVGVLAGFTGILSRASPKAAFTWRAFIDS